MRIGDGGRSVAGDVGRLVLWWALAAGALGCGEDDPAASFDPSEGGDVGVVDGAAPADVGVVDAAAEEPDVAVDVGPACPARPAADAESITFYAMGDPQYGGGSEDKNTFQIAALKAFEAEWPPGMPSAGEAVERPLGLLVAGDLTQSGQDDRLAAVDQFDQVGAFVAEYGLRGGDGDLPFPVYEGYGNHEFDPDEPAEDENLLQWRYHYTEDPTPGVDVVAIRNARRCGLTRVAPDADGHYSWDWGPVHFVNADLFPGDEPSQVDENSRVRDPRRALAFLRQDLAEEVGDSGRPVVVMAHYGFDRFGHEPRWWTDEQKAAFRYAVRPYNVVAYIHGHTHATERYTWEGLDVFNVGSPYYAEYNADGRGHFTVFRITDTHLEAHDVGWSPQARGLDPAWTGWSFQKRL